MHTDRATHTTAHPRLTVCSSRMVSAVNTWGRRSTRHRPLFSCRAAA